MRRTDRFETVFLISREEQITGEVLQEYIDLHRSRVTDMEENYKMYVGDYEIFREPPKDLGKPDNRIAVNFAKYITDTFNGYFIGIPLRLSHEDDQVDELLHEIRDLNSLDDHEAELAKLTSIYGRAYEYLWQDEESRTRITYSAPLDMFVVYDDTVEQRPVFGVRYWASDEGVEGELRTEIGDHHFYTNEQGKLVIEEGVPTFYGGVPIIEYVENDERKAVFDGVKTLINGLNKALSEKADAVEYFADAYMYVFGSEVTDAEAAKLKSNRLLNIFGLNSENINAGFMERPESDASTEHLLDRLTDYIYQSSMVSNISDESFGNASGVALEFKLQPMKNLATLKQRKFQGAMQERWRMIFNIPTNGISVAKRDMWQSIRYQFTLNMPRNLRDEVETAVQLQTMSSSETALGIISAIGNPKDEIDRRNRELYGDEIDYSEQIHAQIELAKRLAPEVKGNGVSE